jgi:hypothetical protein
MLRRENSARNLGEAEKSTEVAVITTSAPTSGGVLWCASMTDGAGSRGVN